MTTTPPAPRRADRPTSVRVYGSRRRHNCISSHTYCDFDAPVARLGDVVGVANQISVSPVRRDGQPTLVPTGSSKLIADHCRRRRPRTAWLARCRGVVVVNDRDVGGGGVRGQPPQSARQKARDSASTRLPRSGIQQKLRGPAGRAARVADVPGSLFPSHLPPRVARAPAPRASLQRVQSSFHRAVRRGPRPRRQYGPSSVRDQAYPNPMARLKPAVMCAPLPRNVATHAPRRGVAGRGLLACGIRCGRAHSRLTSAVSILSTRSETASRSSRDVGTAPRNHNAHHSRVSLSVGATRSLATASSVFGPATTRVVLNVTPDAAVGGPSPRVARAQQTRNPR